MTYANVKVDGVDDVLEDYTKRAAEDDEVVEYAERIVKANGSEIRIGLDSCCVASGTDRIERALEKSLRALNSSVPIKHVSCVHMCHQVPVIEVIQEGKPTTLYAHVQEEDVLEIVTRHFKAQNPLAKLRSSAIKWTEQLYGDLDKETLAQRHGPDVRDKPIKTSTFLSKQVHIATEGRGDIDPASLDEYLRRGGFMAVEKCLFGKSTGVALMSKIVVYVAVAELVSPQVANGDLFTERQATKNM